MFYLLQGDYISIGSARTWGNGEIRITILSLRFGFRVEGHDPNDGKSSGEGIGYLKYAGNVAGSSAGSHATSFLNPHKNPKQCPFHIPFSCIWFSIIVTWPRPQGPPWFLEVTKAVKVWGFGFGV